ncbi:hypothetical protein [Pseudemcibacter aquimaris]|uniref:hypothetical protein n=1 Tax=Pseudemcibacter aquimaris TaxID=2857064 RepID=UPI002010D972|nr:hypothetical protein [Pseudemcibacter aquimaris]MCC3860499.1 hypothetical protein [Pseudemcibacter aquimaris]WDU59324.1 hypothetical protein KW060_03480 [Pseudemcibacter aquimaris]
MDLFSYFLGFILVVPTALQEITVNSGKYADYFHMHYELVPGQYSINLDYGFNQGGQFEVLVPKEYFPIPAPECNKNIIIRMPFSVNENRKKVLYDNLLRATEKTTVTLELNPYVNVINEESLKLELQYCNVFFRHKNGDYHDSLQ